MNATSKLVKAWESKNAKNAAKAGGISLMALSLAACGGSSSTPDSGNGSGSGSGNTPDANKTIAITSNVFTPEAGGSGNDAFAAGISGTTQQITSLHTVNGGTGTDSILMTLNANVAPTLTSIENITVSSAAAVTLDLADSSGVVSVVNKGSSDTVTVSNIGSSVTSVTLSSTANGGTFNYTASTVTGTADAKVVNVSGLSGGTLTIGAGIEELTLNGSGSASTIAALSTGANTLNITGDQAVTITAANTVAETISAGTATGAVTVTSNNTNATSVTTGSGADVVVMTGGAVLTDTIALGAGNDKITFTANLDDADIVGGGEGTDTLIATSADLLALTTALAANDNISGFEKIEFSDSVANGSTLTVASVQKTGVDTVVLDALGTAGTLAVNFVAGANNLELAGVLGGELTVDAAGTATTDAITISNTDAAADAFSDENIVSTDFETLNIVTSGTGANTPQVIADITMTASTGGTTTVKFSGTNEIAVDAVTAAVIDASGLTAQTTETPTFTMTTAAVGVTTITGSDGDDVLRGDAASTINGGAGIDTIIGGTGNDTLNGGAGNDTITINTGDDTVDGGAGDDVVVAADNTSAKDVIVGGDGTDTFAISAAVSAATSIGVSGFEELRFDATATQDMALFTKNSTFTAIDANTAAAVVVNNASSSIAQLHSSTTGSTVTIARLVDTTADKLSVFAQDDLSTDDGVTTYTALVVGDEEELTFTSGSNAGEDLTVTDLTAGDVTKITLTGTADAKIVNDLNTETALATVDATGLTGAAEVHATGSLTAVTMTAGAGGAEFSGGIRADILTGGAGADILHGDNGADTISGGGGIDNILGEAGADIINGGDGADVIAGGAGADTITGGAGADEFDYADDTTTVVTVAGADTITDFTTGSDTIDVDGYSSVAAGTIIVEDGSALVDFADFVTRADATLDDVATDEIFVAFNAFGTGDAYVIADTDGDGSFTVGDALIILTGINTATEIVAADFI